MDTTELDLHAVALRSGDTSQIGRVAELLEAAASLIRELRGENGEYGCHCDLEDGMVPDGCVIDEGRPHDCHYAGQLLKKTLTKSSCEYWKPIRS